jgi:hypothetical protein
MRPVRTRQSSICLAIFKLRSLRFACRFASAPKISPNTKREAQRSRSVSQCQVDRWVFV